MYVSPDDHVIPVHVACFIMRTLDEVVVRRHPFILSSAVDNREVRGFTGIFLR